jgi:RNA polymerase sigma factor for flagellar operon FliA
MPRQSEEELERTRNMWVEYKTNPTKALQRQIIKKYEPLVHKIASGFLHKRPSVLDYDDLISAGTIGLLDAIEKFDPYNERKAQFQTYATFRVRGSILDEINSMDWTPRSVRQNIRGVLASIEAHYRDSQSEPTVDDISKGTDFDVAATKVVLQQMNKTFIVHIEQEAMDALGPITDPNVQELQRTVSVAMKTFLNEDERAFIMLKFFIGYSNKEIQETLGIKTNELKLLRESSLKKLTVALDGAV